MRHHITPDATHYARMTTEELRRGFLIADLFTPGRIDLVYTDLDRMIVGSAVPLGTPLALVAGEALKADFFCQRRELGVLNVGGAGRVTVDGVTHDLAKLDILYVGRGSRDIVFTSLSADTPALFYLASYPAHAEHPNTAGGPATGNVRELGATETANKRRLTQVIHENGIRSCQLVMGFTELHSGGVWNTMPPHTHDRRTEAYLYFDIPEGQRVLHLFGRPDETRPLWVGNLQVALSPSWSIHSGCGTASYRFCWHMGGENQRFDDMDPAPVSTLR